MTKNILIAISLSIFIFAAACKSNTGTNGNKPLTSNVPSTDRNKKEGTSLANYTPSASQTVLLSTTQSETSGTTTTGGGTETASKEVENPEDEDNTYSVLARLYDTVWYQSEDDYDDGKLETEEKFISFSSDYKRIEQEYENGVLEETDNSKVSIIDVFTGEDKDKYCVVVDRDLGKDKDMDIELYYLQDEDTLYIIDIEDINNKDNADKLKELVNKLDLEDKYVLSTTPAS